MTERRRRFLMLALLAVVGACGGDGEQASDRGAPVVRGLGGEVGEPAMGDTIDLRTIGYSRGSEEAPVKVYEFSDFGCPFCAMFANGTYREIHEEFVETGLVRWTFVPFVMGMFPNGAEAARAAECAGEQDRFWEMHDLLYETQREWKATGDAEQFFQAVASRIPLDAGQFSSCFRDDRAGSRTAVNNRAAAALHVRATPSFFVNGRLLEGAPPPEQFRRVLSIMAGQE